ncbi:MAG: hypothetical protein ACREMU_12040, partial [Gemmatimonadaceae bacterium]
RLSHRVRFLVRRGLLPWGILAGVVAGGLGALAGHAAATPPSTVGIITIAAICFAAWSVLVGWAVGAIRWAMRNGQGHGKGNGKSDSERSTHHGASRPSR